MHTITECARRVVEIRREREDAVGGFCALENLNGVGSPEARAYEPVVDAFREKVDEAERALLATPAETPIEFVRKVALLCEERADEDVLDGLREEAERLLTKQH